MSSSSSGEEKIRIDPPSTKGSPASLSQSKKKGGLGESKRAKGTLEDSKIGSAVGHAAGMLRVSKKKKEKGEKSQPTYELDLDTLDIVEVSQSHSASEEELAEMPPKYSTKDIPVFDFMPDEVLMNIFTHLDEKQSVIFGSCCHRFNDVLNDNEIWQEKAKGWSNIHVTKADDGQTRLKEFYVSQYHENQRIQRNKEWAAKQKKRQIKINKQTKRCFRISKFLWLRRISMEIPLSILILFWTILIAVRADKYILWDWHAVYSPIYFGLVWIFCGLVATDILRFRITHPQFKIAVKVESAMTLILQKASPFTKIRKISLYVADVVSLVWLILVADYQNESSWVLTSSHSVITVIPIGFSIFYIMGAFYFVHDYEKKLWMTMTAAAVMCFLWLYFSVWLKADNWTVPSFSWWAAFHPWWILLFFVLLMLIPATLASLYFWLIDTQVTFYSEEGQMIFGMGVCGWSFVLVFVFIGFLCANLEWEEHELTTWPWVITFIPLFVAEVAGILGCVWANYILNDFL